MNDTFEIIGAGCAVLVISFLFIGMMMVPMTIIESFNCRNTGNDISKTTEYNFFGAGCMVKVDGQFIPYDRWIHNDGK